MDVSASSGETFRGGIVGGTLAVDISVASQGELLADMSGAG